MSERPDEAGSLDALAAEYVIGTLDADERTAFSARLATDEAARGAVAAWDRRLAPLGRAGRAVQPPADLWPRIEHALGRHGGARLRIVDGGAPNAATVAWRSRDRWRAFALSSAGIAAALVAFVAAREIGPLRQPASTDANATYVAAVNRGGDKPALIVTVDLATRQVLVRPVSAEAPAGHSLQLWYVGKGHSPRSMGLVTRTVAHETIPEDAGADAEATFAVSVEPPGGSTTGGPTGAVLYSGQLVKE